MLFQDEVTCTLKQMSQEASINEMSFMNGGYDAINKITFKSDCTVSQRINPHNCRMLMGDVHMLKTTKGENMIFPEIFTNLFQVLFAQVASMPFRFSHHQPILHSTDSKGFLYFVYKSMVVPFTNLEKENNDLRKQLEEKDQQLEEMKKQLESKDQELKIKHDKYLSELLKVSTLKFALEAKDEELEEELEEKDQQLKEKDQEIQVLKEELEIKYHDYLMEVQEEFDEKEQEIETKDQELKDAQKEVMTRGLLLKSCVDDLKTCIEKVEDVEKKNQELEHLNHRLIYGCERKSSSYFGPEM